MKLNKIKKEKKAPNSLQNVLDPLTGLLHLAAAGAKYQIHI